MKPEKVQATTSSSDASINLTCNKNQKNSSHLYPHSESNTSNALNLEKQIWNVSNEITTTTTSGNKQVISRYNETSNNECEVIDDGVSRADEEQSSNSIENKKLCLIKCKNSENEVNSNESSEENRPLVLIENNQKSAKLISLKKNGSTLVFQKKLNASTNDTAKKNSLKNWQSNSNNSKSHQWSVSDIFSSDIQNFNSDINVSICVILKFALPTYCT